MAPLPSIRRFVLLKYVIKRLLSAIPVLLIVVSLVFFLMRIIPGDPALLMLGDDYTMEEYEMLREQLGLNKPMAQQFIEYVFGILSGEWGDSLFNSQPVLKNIQSKMEPTILVTVYSTIIAVVISIPFGIISARRRNTPVDFSLTFLSVIALSLPSFWLGLMLIYAICVKTGLFPVQGYKFISEVGLWKSLHYLTVPCLVLGFRHVGSLTRYTRSTMLDVLGNDYIKTARAKGLAENKVYYKHALKNAMAPVVTNIGVQVASLLGGATIIENVFNIPGMGKLAYDSLMRRDYNQEQAIILFVAMVFIIMNILLDIIYNVLDPRVRFE